MPVENQVRSTLRAPVDPFIQPADASDVGARALNGRKVLPVRGEIDPLSGVLGRYALLLQLGALPGDVGEIALKCRDETLVVERYAVPGQIGVELQLLQRL